MSSFIQDLRFALRRLTKSPGFVATSLVILGLGIGATTTIFSVVYGVLLRPLDYPSAERLYEIDAKNSDGDELGISYQDYLDWEGTLKSFEALGAYRFGSMHLTGGMEPAQLRHAHVTQGFFDVFQVVPQIGRTFQDDENDTSPANVVVLAHHLWQVQLGGRRDALGETLTLNGEPYEIIGVMPASFERPDYADFWLPLGDLTQTSREQRLLTVAARLKEGTKRSAAVRELDLLAARMAADHPEVHDNNRLVATTLLEERIGDLRQSMWLLFGAVAGVLLIVCLNIAALQLVRGLERRHEVAMRTVLGAERSRVIRQLLTESILIALMGGGLGVLLAFWGLDLVVNLAPPIPRLNEVSINLQVVAFAFLISLASGVLFGLLPALRNATADLSGALKGAKAEAQAGWGAMSLRGWLVVAQIALTLVLLIGAGLLGRSFQRLQAVDVGVDVEQLVSIGLVMPPDVYPEGHQKTRFLREVGERIERISGVERASAGNYVPMNGPGTRVSVSPKRFGRDEKKRDVYEQVVDVGYFETLGLVPIVGRTLTAADDENAPDVALVNASLAERLWPGELAVGEDLVLHRPNGEDLSLQVIGVVPDIYQNGPSQPVQPAFYRAHAQSPWGYMNLLVRSVESDPQQLIPAIRAAIWEIDPDRPLFAQNAMGSVLNRQLSAPRFNAALLGIFSLFALLLAAVGIYSVMAFAVGQRHREIGIRMALGASRGRIYSMVMNQGLKLALLGLGFGVLSAMGATRILESFLFGLTSTDLPTFIGVSTVLLVAATLAIYMPASRASRVDPMVTLRDD